MKIDWRRKLSSRKFWAAVGGMAAAVLAFVGASEQVATQVTAIISAAGVLIAYILAEGFTDAAHAEDRSKEGGDAGQQ